jgi:histidinol dehydrogenase
MPSRLDSQSDDFAARFDALLSAKREQSQEVGDAVAAILADVRKRGDAALIDLTRKFDRFDLTPETLRVSRGEIEAALKAIDPKLRSAIETARDRIAAHHEKQKPQDQTYRDALGVTLGSRWTAVESAGIYVPGGLGAYPSSVLMNAVPAKVAGVERIAMVVPTPGGVLSDAVLAAASLAGVEEIYRVGGAQAIGALAYGTETIAPVVKIVGVVGIDMIAGPSDVLVVADSSANPAWVAADLLAQAEHGMGAQAILITTDTALADAVSSEAARQLSLLPRKELAAEGWDDLGAIITVPDLGTAMRLANSVAPEHLELLVDDPDALLSRVRNAGAVFLGHHTPEAIGDYVGGTNHVLPTARTARFASGLGVLDFMKRTSILGCDPGSLAALSEPAMTLAESEDLSAHARSISIRLNR